jgi:molecular chaperone GrpE (heat shock protein)
MKTVSLIDNEIKQAKREVAVEDAQLLAGALDMLNAKLNAEIKRVEADTEREIDIASEATLSTLMEVIEPMQKQLEILREVVEKLRADVKELQDDFERMMQRGN